MERRSIDGGSHPRHRKVWTPPLLLIIDASTLVTLFATLAGRRRQID